MKRGAKKLASALGLGVFVAVLARAPTQRWAHPQPAWAARLLGPVAEAAADLLWLRVETARRQGRHEELMARAELALRIDPSATEGWDFLAHHQALYLGSTLRQADPRLRALHLRAGLATAKRGELRAERPEQLAFLRGVLLQTHAENDPGSAWPGGTAGLWRAAAEAYSEAARLGHANGERMAAGALESSADVGIDPGAVLDND